MLKLQSCYTILITMILISLLAACGSSQQVPADGSGDAVAVLDSPRLSWPPADVAPRSASDDSIEVLGKDAAMFGDGAHAVGDICKLNDGTAPWAIYSLSSFNTVQLGSIDIEYNTLVGEGTTFYIGMANYEMNRWEWFTTENKTDYTFIPQQDTDYYSPNGNVHIAVLRTGPATIDIQKLIFHRIGEVSITPPQNLRSDEQTPENIGLQWDPVPGAESYNVYFSRWPDLSGPLKANSEPVIGADYDYAPVLKGVIYYFYVTAVGAVESDPSDYIDLFAPLIDMPAPTNPHVQSATPDSVTIAWEWDTEELGPEPASGFYVYLKAEKDFNLEPVIEQKHRNQSWARNATFTGLEQGTLYYYRICGVSLNNARGRMTDDLPALTGELWDWSDSNAIAPGGEPIRAVVTGNEISAVWFDANGETGVATGGVTFAQGIGGNWTTGSCGLDGNPSVYKSYLDIDERGGEFLVSTFEGLDLNLVVSYGNPGGGWTAETVAEGTKKGQFDSPSAGNHGDCAITDDSYAIIHKDWYGDFVYIHSMPRTGGSWTADEVFEMADGAFPVGLDLKANGNNLEFLFFDYEAHELKFDAGPAPYNPVIISDNMGANNGLATDLLMTPSGWVTTSYDATNDDLYLLRQDGTEWNSEEIAVLPGDDQGFGRNARLAQFRTGLICAYVNESNNWFCSVYTGTDWVQQSMLLGLPSPATSGELVVVNDVPYFLVEDTDDDLIYCIEGSIPPFSEL